MSKICPTCGQSWPERRLGVRMSPLKARIFDLIQRGGPDGTPTEYVFNTVFGDSPVERTNLKVHVAQINDKLEGLGYRIVWTGSKRAANYVLKQVARHG